jgi:hypothetical protein
MQWVRRTRKDVQPLTGQVRVSIAHYRSAPDTAAPVEDALSRGHTLPLFGRSSNAEWVTPFEDGHLWVHVSHLRIDGEVDSLPVIGFSLS